MICLLLMKCCEWAETCWCHHTPGSLTVTEPRRGSWVHVLVMLQHLSCEWDIFMLVFVFCFFLFFSMVNCEGLLATEWGKESNVWGIWPFDLWGQVLKVSKMILERISTLCIHRGTLSKKHFTITVCYKGL